MSTLLLSPSSPLHTLENSFTVLAQGPSQPCLDVSPVEGITAHWLSPSELAQVLGQASVGVRDGLWRLLVRQARAERSTWVVIAAGLALPGLRAVVARWTRNGVNRQDLSAEVLAQFVAGLWEVDLEPSYVCSRLCYQADKAARRYYYRHRRDRARLAPQSEVTVAAPVPQGHPEQVLARAVRMGVLGGADAELVARSRLESRSLRSAARELGVCYGTAKWRRQRAERRLHAWLTEDTPFGSCYPDGELNSPYMGEGCC